MRGVVILILFLFLHDLSCAAPLTTTPTSLEELCLQQPEMVEQLFRSLDLDRPELAQVAESFHGKNLPEACRRLISYYKTSAHYIPSYSVDSLVSESEAELHGTFTFQQVTGTVPRLPNGYLDWNYCGPKNDVEWWGMLQRHAFIPLLVQRWEKTGDKRYATAFDRYITDWIISNPEPENGKAKGGWETMLIARRISDSWAMGFFHFQKSEKFTDVARIMMLSSTVRQTEFLVPRLTEEGNHLNAELLAIATTAAAWPELRHSREWLDFAASKQLAELEARVYPDGTQKELSNHYQIVVANHTERLASLLHFAKHPAANDMYKKADLLWSAVAAVAGPDGYGPLNNDGDLENNLKQIATARTMRQDAGVPFPDLLPPPQMPYKRVLPWAGEIIMGVPNVGEIFFDVGPLGTAHQHYDSLHFSLFVHDREVLVDSGRYTYQVINSWRKYFTGPWGHNVVIIDGGLPPLEPLTGTHEVKSDFPILTSSSERTQRTWGEVSFRGTGLIPSRPITHRRSIVQLESTPACWIVVDEIETTGTHHLSIPWHFHPSCTVEIDPSTQITETADPGHGNLRLIPIPIGKSTFDSVRLVKGQREPVPLGWYSPEYNVKIASPIALYEKEISGPTILAWLLIPEVGQRDAKGEFAVSPHAFLQRISSKDYLTINTTLKYYVGGTYIFLDPISIPLGEK